MKRGCVFVTQHAVSRVRLRWKGAASLSHESLIDSMVGAVSDAAKRKESVIAPGGTYVPFSLDGCSGYLVVKDDRVVTALPAEHCPEVTQILEERRNGLV